MTKGTTKKLQGLRVVLVNPGLFPSDITGEYHTPDRWMPKRTMNFGLLVVASVLVHNGAEVIIHDHKVLPDSEATKTYVELLDQFSPHAVGVGITSVFGYLPSLNILRLAHDKGVKTIVGGQAAGNFGDELLAEDSPCDVLVVGDAEEILPELLNSIYRGKTPPKLPGVAFKNEAVPSPAVCDAKYLESYLEYELYPNWRSLFPVVEESRACPYSCRFCTNSQTSLRKWRGKNPKVLVKEVERVLKIWQWGESSPIVLMCSNFGTNPTETESFLKGIRASGLEPRFLASMRVDGKWDRFVSLMEGLFDHIQFGLESGSPRQLLAMRKCKSPSAYLEKAKLAFQTFSAYGIHVAANFIFGYFGETFKSAGETINFILSNSEFVHSVMGGPFKLYPNTPSWEDLDIAREEFGAELYEVSDYCRRLKTYPIHPSKYFSHKDAAECSLLLMKMINNTRRYYEHHRWYVGPENSTKDRFIAKDVFYQNLLRKAEWKDLSVNLAAIDNCSA